jgi:putative MATE family efflux protein
MVPTKKALRLITRIGLPASIGQGMSALGFTVLQGVVNSFGTAVVAAFGIGNRMIGLFNMPAMGFSRATAALVGQSLGAKDRVRARLVVRQSVLTIAVFISLCMVFVFFWGSSFIRFFIDDAEVIGHGVRLLRTVSLSAVLFALFIVITGAFQGGGDTKPVMYLNAARLWVFRVPLAYLLGYTFRQGPQGIWLAMFLSNLAVAAIGFYLLRTGRWMHKLNPDEL